MPTRVTEIPVPNDDFLVKDAVLERIWGELHREMRLPEKADMQFITWIIPSRVREVNGVYRAEGKKAAFMVVSPNPNGDDKPPLRTYGTTPLKDYQLALKDVGHYVGGPHPAKTIFAHLVLAHAKAIGAVTGLTDMDEETYFKNLDTARWLVEQAQGKRYEAGITMY
jgi:hypothetical protein